MELLDLCETLKRTADDVADTVIRRWGRIGTAEPWLALPADLDFDHLPELIRTMSAASLCTEFDPGLCSRVVEVGATHGEHRRADGFEDELIYREYHLLRRTLWEHLRDAHGDSAAVHYASMRLDAISGLATAAALHGMHREQLESQGRWPDVLDEVLADWPLPGR